MNRDDDRALWDLLGERTAPAHAPMFARNVIRAIRTQPSRWSILPRWHLMGISGATAAVLFTIFVVRHFATAPPLAPPSGGIASAVAAHDDDFDTDMNDLVAGSDDADDDVVAVL